MRLILLLAFFLACKNKSEVPKVSEVPDHLIVEELKEKMEETDTVKIETINEVAVVTDTVPKKEIKKELIKETPKQKVKKYASIKFENREFSFDTITEGEEVNHKFSFVNDGDIPLKIYKVVPSCGCTMPSYPFVDIAPRDTGFIGVNYNSVGKDGEQIPKIEVFTNTKNSPISLFLTGYVKQAKK